MKNLLYRDKKVEHYRQKIEQARQKQEQLQASNLTLASIYGTS